MAKRTYETFYAESGDNITFTKDGKSNLKTDKKYYDKINLEHNILESQGMYDGDLVYVYHDDSDDTIKTTFTFKGYMKSNGKYAITAINNDIILDTYEYPNAGKLKNGVTTFTNTFMKDEFTINTADGGKFVINGATKNDKISFGSIPDSKTYAKKGNDLIITAVKDAKTSTVTVKNYYKMKEEDANAFYQIENIASVAAQVSGKKITGGFTNDLATSTKNNETFTLGSGKNKIVVDLTKGNFGKDTINLTKGEDLTLEFSGDAVAGQIVSSVAKNGKDMEVTVYGTKENNTVVDTDTVLGKFVLKNAAAKDLIGLNGASGSHFVKIDSLKTDIANIFNVENVVTAKNNKFTGTSLRDVATSTGKNETFALGASRSSNIIYFNDSSLTNGFGNDKVITDELGRDHLVFAEDATLSYAKSKNGKDIIITAQKGGTELGTVTLTNYLKNANDNVYLGTGLSNKLSNELKKAGVMGTIAVDSAKIDKKNTLKGDFFDQTITGGNNADTIYANGGKNTITGGKGDDKMYAGTGVDTFQIAVGDAAGNKGDIIYNAQDNDRVYFGTWTTGETPTFNAEDNLNNVKFTKSGNDLIAEHTDGASTPTIDKVTIANYFKDENHLLVMNGQNIALKAVNISGKGTIKGTKYNDYMTGSAKVDKIYTGAGTDEITAGGGNDTIYVDGKGTKTLYIDRNSGKDTIIVTDRTRTSANLLNVMFDGTKNTDYTLSYDRSADGKDLVINAVYKKTSELSESTATVAVKDYFTNYVIREGLRVNNTASYAEDVYTATLTDNESISGNPTKGDSIYKIDAIAQSTVNIQDESGNDLYIVRPHSDKELNSTVVIDDKSGKDTLIINAAGSTEDIGVNPLDVGVIFDVFKKGSTEPVTSLDDYLKIFSYDRLHFNEDGLDGTFYMKSDDDDDIITKSEYDALTPSQQENYSLVTEKVYKNGSGYTTNATIGESTGVADFGGVIISDFIDVSSRGKYSVGDGAIETIYINDRDGYCETMAGFSSSKLESLRSQVAGWLANNKYDSTFDVLETGTKDDIQELLAIYNKNYMPDEPQA